MSPNADLFRQYLRRQSATAFRRLVERRSPEVFSLCLHVLHDRQLAEDAAQEVFLLLRARAGSIDPERLAGWLVNTSRLVAKRLRRKHRAQLAMESRPRPLPESSDVEPVENSRQIAGLNLGLEQLPPDVRKLIQRYFFEGASHAQLARELGLTPAAARKRLSRALAQLRATPAIRSLHDEAE